MMRKIFLVSLSIYLVSAFVLGIFCGQVNAKPRELSWATHIPPTHLRWKNVTGPWVKMIEEKTKGQIKIRPYFKGALMKNAYAWDGVKKGVADIASHILSHTKGRFPLTEAVQRPGLGLTAKVEGGPDSQLACNALWDAYKNFPELAEEYAGVKVLAIHTGVSIGIKTIKEINGLEDLKGVKLSCPGASQAKVAKALGATPVTMKMSEIYLAMEKGVTGGYIGGSGLLVSRKYGEITKYSVLMDAGHGSPMYIVMNKRTWNSLPEDVQAVFEEFSGAWLVDYIGKGRDAQELVAREKAVKEMGHTFKVLPPKEMARWNERLSPLADEYAEELEAKGLPGKKLIQHFRSYAEEHGG